VGRPANSGNATAVAAVYATDASLLPPNLPVQRGRTAIRAFWGGLLEAYTVTFEISTDIIEGRGDLAYEMGHYRFTAVPKSKSAPGIADEGKYVDSEEAAGRNLEVCGGHLQLQPRPTSLSSQFPADPGRVILLVPQVRRAPAREPRQDLAGSSAKRCPVLLRGA
jgi:SnoaL-like protein